jgi:hypothetical protein
MHWCHLALFARLASEASPSRPWVSEIVESCALHIAQPQHLEAARRWCYDFNSIAQFDVELQRLFRRDRRYIFNADLTTLSGLKRFVLTETGKLPFITAEMKLPYLTGMCAVSATGMAYKPFIILPHLQGLKS